MNCPICKSNLIEVLNLGKHPLCDDLKKIGDNSNNKLYKIVIEYCNNCSTAFQKYNVNKKILFSKTYHYRSKFTDDVLFGMKDLVEECKKKLGDLKNKTILDVGTNDGSLLDFFKKYKSTTIGIEPTGAAKDANRKKHYIINEYFNERSVKILQKKYNKIDIITFTNVFAHIDDIQLLIKNLKKIINEDTLLVIENHYLGSVLKKKQFDTFYHEHPRTYSLKSFIHIAKLLDMNVVDYSFPKRYGGNIRVFLKRNHKNVQKKFSLIKDENNFKIYFSEIKKFIKFWKFRKLKILKKSYKKYGLLDGKAFPGRAAILIKILGINEKIINSVYEKPNSKKNGFYIPGTKIPIKSDRELLKKIKKLKIIINFAWHIDSEIKTYLKRKGFKGKVIDILDKQDLLWKKKI
jgi:SAM-dependent methyltransferase